MMEGGYDDAFLACLAYLDNVRPTKTIRPNTNSYALKHRAEKYRSTYPQGEPLGPTYVPNGIFIAAALHLGFRMRTRWDERGYESPNATFNMSTPTLRRPA